MLTFRQESEKDRERHTHNRPELKQLYDNFKQQLLFVNFMETFPPYALFKIKTKNADWFFMWQCPPEVNCLFTICREIIDWFVKNVLSYRFYGEGSSRWMNVKRTNERKEWIISCCRSKGKFFVENLKRGKIISVTVYFEKKKTMMKTCPCVSSQPKN